jgi:hypothetical protein
MFWESQFMSLGQQLNKMNCGEKNTLLSTQLSKHGFDHVMAVIF